MALTDAIGKGSNPAAGGVTAGQQALGQFTLGQNLIGNAGAFSQTPMSTMKTMADAGSYMGEAQLLSQLSQADTQASNAAQAQNKANIGNSIGGLGTTLGGLA